MSKKKTHFKIILEIKDHLEDMVLSAIAEIRDTQDAITINHENVWIDEILNQKNVIE